MTVVANQGSIYANAIESTGAILDTSALKVASVVYEGGGIQAGALFNETLSTANGGFNDTSRGDKIEIIEVGNSNARSTASARIIVSPNDAYLQAEPWWITTFSA